MDTLENVFPACTPPRAAAPDPWPVDAVVLVTGASSGIGEAVARALAAQGAHAVLVARRRERLDAVLGSFDDPGAHGAFVADVCDPGQVDAAVAAAVARFGRLDAVVANAGLGSFAPLADTPSAVLRALVDTNLLGVLYTLHAALPHLCATRGRVLLVGSGAGRRGVPGVAAYSATKAALFGLADALRVELAPAVTVTVASPGSTRSGFFDAAFGGAAARGADPAQAARLVLRALASRAPAVDAKALARARAALNALAPRAVDAWLRWRLRVRG